MQIHERIIEIYKSAQIKFLDYPNEKSEYWKEYYNSIEKFSDKEKIRSFRSRNSLSTSLDDAYIGENFAFKIFAELLAEIGEGYVMERLPKENIGQSYAAWQIGGRYVDYNTLFHIRWLKDMDEMIFAGTESLSACEIGGGYGSLARLLLTHSPVTKFISIDLPEANLMTTYFLAESLPAGTRFYLYDDYLKDGDSVLSVDAYQNHDVFILPPWVALDPALKLDLFINARSMMEMRMEVIHKYFTMIHGNLREGGYFLNINRYHKSWADSVIRIGDYPYDKSWKVIASKPSYLQPHIRLLLAQRLSGEAGDIGKELADLREMASAFAPRVNRSCVIMGNLLKKILGKGLLNRIGRFLSSL